MKRCLLGMCVMLPLMADSKDMDEHTRRIYTSATVLTEIMGAPDKSIPEDLLGRAQCVGVIPGLKRAGFVIGGKYGKGVLTCRLADGTGWSAPSTVRVEGGSIGLQIGVGETDVVFIVMNKRGVEKLMKDKFTIGGDASAMAGPVGRSTEARTDALMHAEILAYSRARGVFAGVSLEGATLRPDNDDNAKLYGGGITHPQILRGQVKAPASALPLFDALNRVASYQKKSNAEGASNATRN